MERDLLKKVTMPLSRHHRGMEMCGRGAMQGVAAGCKQVGSAEWCCVPDEKSLTGVSPGITLCRSSLRKHEEQNLCRTHPPSGHRKRWPVEVLYSHCCGINVHKQTAVACVAVQAATGKATKEIRTFGTMTDELLVLADWLEACGVTHVAMESTGVYWKPLWNLMEERFTAAGQRTSMSRRCRVARQTCGIASGLSISCGMDYSRRTTCPTAPNGSCASSCAIGRRSFRSARPR